MSLFADAGGGERRSELVLLVAGQPDALLVELGLRERAGSLELARSVPELLERLRLGPCVAVLAGGGLELLASADLLQRLAVEHPRVLRVLLTRADGLVAALDAVNKGIAHKVQLVPSSATVSAGELLVRLRAEHQEAQDRRSEADAAAQARRELERELRGAEAELREVREQLGRLVTSDGLTGVYTDRHFLKRWRREVARARRYRDPLSVLLIELGDWSELASEDADAAAKQLAQLLTAAVREVDIVARYGPGEFIIGLPKARKVDAASLGSRLLESVRARPFQLPGGRSLSASLFVGVANYPVDGREAHDVLRAVERALIRAHGEQAGVVMSTSSLRVDASDQGADVVSLNDERGHRGRRPRPETDFAIEPPLLSVDDLEGDPDSVD